MANPYTRQSSFSDGDTINSALFNEEYDQLVLAFSSTVGHTHDGSTGEGAPVTKLGPTQDVVIAVGSMLPKTNNTVDLGSSALKFKDGYFAGNVTVDGVVTHSGNMIIGNAATDTLTINATIQGSSLVFEGATANAHELTLAIPDAASDITVTLPNSTDTLVGKATTDVLTNKTLTSAVLNTGVSGSAILDEDNMATNSATQLATQQSIKAYVDTAILTEDTLAELNDTNITSAADASLLLYDTATSTWRDAAMSGAATIGDTGVITIANDAIDSQHYAADSIDAEHYAAGSVDTTALGADAVTSAKIADNAVDTEHLADDAVDSAEIAAGAIDTAHITDDQVTYAKIQNVSADERILGRVSGADGVIEELTKAQVLTFANVEDGADVTDSTNVVAALTAGTGITISGGGTVAAGPIALTTVQTAANQAAQLALTTEAGDVVVRSDESKTYIHNGGSAGSMLDFTLMSTPTDAVTSVAGNTGVVTNAHIATAVEAASGSNTFTDADHSKLDAVAASANNYVHPNHSGDVVSTADGATVIQVDAVDIPMLSATGTASSTTFLRGDNTWDVPIGGVTSVNSVTGAVTAAHIATAVEAASDSNTFTDADHSKLNAVAASANNYVHPNHSGDVVSTADGATVIQVDAVDIPMLSATGTASSTTFLRGDNSWGVPIGGVTSVNSVTGAITAAHIATAVEAASDSNTFTDADHTKLNAVAASANNYVHPNHSGEVTSTADGATVVADNVIDEANLKVSNAPTNGYVLQAQSGASGGLTWAVDAGGSNVTTSGLWEHTNTIATNYVIASGNNALTAGPITVNSGVSVTVPTGSTWVIA